MKKQKENSHEGITWSEMGKQNAQAEKVYWMASVKSTELNVKKCLIILFTALKCQQVFNNNVHINWKDLTVTISNSQFSL